MREELEERRAQLVQVLRSGRFQQGMGKLRSVDDKYCCLGVACEVAIENGIALESVKVPDEYTRCWSYRVSTERGHTGHTHTMPELVKNWYGFDSFSGVFKHPVDGCRTLATLNDTKHDFNFIANVIESNPEGLWVDE